MRQNRTERQRLRPERIRWRMKFNCHTSLIRIKRVSSMRTLAFMTLGLVILASGSVHAQGVVLPLPPEDQQNITAQLGPGVVGAALPSQPISDPSIYFPLQQKSQQFQVVAGPHAGTVQTLGLWQARRPGGRKAWRFQMTPILGGVHARDRPGRHHNGRPHRFWRGCSRRHDACQSVRAQGHATGRDAEATHSRSQ